MNRLTVIGTEMNDRYVVQSGKVFGGGLTIKFTNIAFLDAVGEEGDDEFVILSTFPNMLLTLYGGLGSDIFTVTPRTVGPVISKNLRGGFYQTITAYRYCYKSHFIHLYLIDLHIGHRGIIEHTVSSSSDPDYDDIKIRGVAVDILDNDENGYVSVVDQTIGYHLMSEDGLPEEEFTFHIFPTQMPADDVVVEIVAPVARDGETFLLVNDKEIEKFTFTSTNYAPQPVRVSYNTIVSKLTLTEVNLMLKLLVKLDGDEDTTFDQKFRQTEQVS